MPDLALWGGIECSVVRLGAVWRDQVRETGHHARGTRDLERIAALGLRTLRYPLLWERCQYDRAERPAWAWHDAQLGSLERLGIAPIAGLLHHGAGPLASGLLDPAFAEGLADHAGAVARRYESIAWWVPVNEPLTTARFACLYGHWHPHLQDESAFLRAVAAQCRAALLAMRAIRAHTPAARFVHTEDLGRTFSTPQLSAQADYENERRWLSLDLLCGRLDRHHPWRGRLEASGVAASDLDALATGEAAPDLLGINHYVTSERFLDHRLALYPPRLHGGNGRQAYADTEATRMNLPADCLGWAPRLREVWHRYGRPLAITEAHLGSSDPLEQLRWLMQAWGAAQTLRGEGADVRAVTAWGLLGLVDWNSLLCARENHYEPGAFDIRQDPPAPTLLAGAIASLVQNGRFEHAALATEGWWQQPARSPEPLRRA